MVNIGIAGTHCKCHFGESFAVLSHPATGAPGIFIIDSGSKKELSTPTVNKILACYNADELAGVVLEAVRFDGHELLLVHFPRHTLCFDSTASGDSPQWCILKSGLYDDVYRAVDFVWDGSAMTVGDKMMGITGVLDFAIASQYGEAVELLLHTTLAKADNLLLFDFEIETTAGLALYAEKCFIAATTDGINYGREQLIPCDDRYRYDQRIIWRRVGRCRKNIGFRLRFVTKTPAALAYCQLRIGYG